MPKRKLRLDEITVPSDNTRVVVNGGESFENTRPKYDPSYKYRNKPIYEWPEWAVQDFINAADKHAVIKADNRTNYQINQGVKELESYRAAKKKQEDIDRGYRILGPAAAIGAASVVPQLSPIAGNILGGAFVAHGAYDLARGEATPLTALELSPLVGSSLKGAKFAGNLIKNSKAIKNLWNNGRIIQKNIPYNPNHYYRAVGEDAIVDANNTGIIAAKKGSEYAGPNFKQGSVPSFTSGRNYVIDAGENPGTEWISGKLYERDLAEFNKQTLTPSNANSAALYPLTNGKFYLPANSATYWKRSPIIGWRQRNFKQSPLTAKSASNIPYIIADLPGYQLKSLMMGNPIEKQLSKDGTINVNNIIALSNKASDVEKDVINRILNLDEFAGKKNIDYNNFRKAVQKELVNYERIPTVGYDDYGMDRLGFSRKFGNVSYELEPDVNAFYFRSPRIGAGNDKHYDSTTLGHSRTYTTKDEPNVLHVMESQSDWGQAKLEKPKYIYQTNSEGKLTFGLPKNEFYGSYPHAQAKYLHDNYTHRQIQENLKYAAQNHQTKMRYPTPETAAKIEGYPKNIIHRKRKWIEELELEALNRKASYLRSKGHTADSNPELKEIDYRRVFLENPYDRDYIPEYKTILKKYADFPKHYNKLYKDADIRVVSDKLGNSWYEVDVPKNYLNSEWQYSLGGLVNLARLNKLYNK